MLFRKVIRRIKSEFEKDQWIMSATDAALYLGIGGFIDDANKLLTEIWKHRLPYDRTTWLADRAFEILWYASGKRPENVPFEMIDIYELEKSYRNHLVDPLWATQWATQATDPLTKGMVLASTKDERFPDLKTELEALNYFLLYFDNAVEKPPYQVCQALSLATELASRNSKEDIAIDLLKKWANKFGKYPYDSAVTLIGCNRHVAPLLIKGIIADELGLTEENCKVFVDEAIAAIKYRMKNGLSLVYGDLDWNQLLQKLSILSINKEPDEYTELQRKNKWIGSEPATLQAINSIEKKLNLQLPDDYKDFLKVSNGFSRFPLVNPSLAPIEKVDYLKDVYMNIYGDTNMFEIIQGYPDRNGDGDIAPLIEKAIAISSIPDEQEVWLISSVEKGKDGECWFFAAWFPGERRYKSFRYFIEEQIQQLEDD